MKQLLRRRTRRSVPSETMVFRVGDVARANDSAPSDFIGRRGIVTEIGPGDAEYRVEFEDGRQPTTAIFHQHFWIESDDDPSMEEFRKTRGSFLLRVCMTRSVRGLALALAGTWSGAPSKAAFRTAHRLRGASVMDVAFHIDHDRTTTNT
jgi:hypothetical protein